LQPHQFLSEENVTGDGVQPAPEVSAEGEPVSRRVFLGYMAAAVTSFIGVVTGIPVLGYLAAPLKVKAEANWISLGKVKDFVDPAPKVVQFTVTRRDGWVEAREARTCWVSPGDDGKFTVFNGRCTHLGCAYSWQANGEHADHFFCPCHEGLYDKEGKVLDGPPPRALDRLDTKVEDDQLMVLYQDFRPGVPQKDPL